MRIGNFLHVLRRHWGAAALAVGLLAATAPIAVLLASASARGYLYRDMSYIHLTNRVVGDEHDPERIAHKLNDFIADNLYPGGGPVLDTNSWNDLVRGVGWCDQDVWLFGTLLATRDIAGRMVFLEGKDGSPQHTVAEVYLDNEWRVFDPLYGLVFRRGSSLATYSDLVADPGIAVAHPAVAALPPSSRTLTQNTFAALYANPEPDDHWTPMTEARYGSSARWMTREVLRWYLRVFGNWGANRFQDVYLALTPGRLMAFYEKPERPSQPVFRTVSEDPALFLYYRARNYHLYGRADDAEEEYRRLREDYPRSEYAEKAGYFLGQLAFTLRGDAQAALDQLSAYVQEYSTASVWLRPAYDLIGRIYEERGDTARAIEHYRLASDDPMLAAAARLARLERER